MTRTALLALASAAALSACGDIAILTPAPAAPSGPVPGAAARAIILPVVEEKAPGAAAVVLTDCIVQNASPAELVTIAGANAGAVPPETVLLISEILARPETTACATSALT